MKKIRLFLTALFLVVSVAGVLAQNITVTGTVTDSQEGYPLVGAGVQVKGQAGGVATDLDGEYSIKANANDVLVFTYINYVTQEVAINGKAVVNVSMKEDAVALDDVIVVAFGTAKKSQFTGSASTIDSEKIVARQTSNVSNALAGQVAGVQVTSSNGEPGAEASIRIRGIGSMAASNAPLYVVDGVPFDGGLETINSQDIASMTVLKDAASNALYGARGANGVILITTKKAKYGSSGKIEFDAKWGTNRRAIANYDVMTDPNMYYETFYKSVASANEGAPSTAIGGAIQGILAYPIYSLPEGEALFTEAGKINPNATLGAKYAEDYYLTPDDWYNEIFDSSNLRQEYNLRFSGATEKMTYYLSAGYLEDTGIIPNSGFERLSFRLNTDYQVNKVLKVGSNISYSSSTSNSPRDQSGSSSGNMFYVTNNMAPIYPLYVRDAEGNIMIDNHGYTIYDFGAGEYPDLARPFMGNSNPASMIALDQNKSVYDVLSARAFANLDIMEGLKFTANWGLDLDNTRSSMLYNAYYGQYSSVGGIIYNYANRTRGFNQQYLLNYNKTFGEHTIEALVGYEGYDYKYSNLYGSKENLYNPNNLEIDNAINNPSVSSYSHNYATQGLLARVQYNYDEKYFASASYRRDASSRFAPENRWGNFWSVGGAWLLNREDFLSNADFIDILKYKISYGMQGNDNLGNYYPYQDQYQVQNSNNDFSTVLSYKGNREITWETSKSFNTGVEFEFFKNRLRGGVEYFSRVTEDMLYNRPVAPTIGYSSYPSNVGSMSNNGVEIELSGDVVRSKNVVWSLFLNATSFKNKIKELSPELEGELVSGSRIYREGESMYQLNLYKYAGVDAETGEATYFKDVLDDKGNVTEQTTTKTTADATRYATGDILPSVYGGFGTTLSAYGFDLSATFAYQLGGRILDYGYMYFMHAGGSSDVGQNWHKDILNAWTPENTSSNIPRLNYYDQYANSLSDRFLVSSNYLSINNITLGYTLPEKLVKKIGLSNIRVYGTIDNVAVFSTRQGLDPRQGYLGSDVDVYSPMRTVSGGVSFSF